MVRAAAATSVQRGSGIGDGHRGHRDHRDHSVTGAGRLDELGQAAPHDAHPRNVGQMRARGGGHALIGIDPGDAREVRGESPGEHAGPAADIHRGPPAGGQITQDPAVEVLIVMPRVARVDPGQPSPGTRQHEIPAVPDAHPGSVPDGNHAVRIQPAAGHLSRRCLHFVAEGSRATSCTGAPSSRPLRQPGLACGEPQRPGAPHFDAARQNLEMIGQQ